MGVAMRLTLSVRPRGVSCLAQVLATTKDRGFDNMPADRTCRLYDWLEIPSCTLFRLHHSRGRTLTFRGRKLCQVQETPKIRKSKCTFIILTEGDIKNKIKLE